jgi:hypothetical protein
MPGRVFDRRLLWLLLLPLAVYGSVYLVVDQVRPTGLSFATIPPERFADVAAAEALHRYFWLSAFLILTAVSLAVATSAALALFREAPGQDLRLVFGLFVTVAVVIIVSEATGVAQRWYTYLGNGLFDSVFARVSVDGVGSALHVFKVAQEIIKATTAVAILLLTACLLMTLSRPAGDLSLTEHAEYLAAAIARQRVYLQQAAVVYVFAVLAMLSWMYWPLPFLASDALRADYKGVVMGAAVLQGVAFSIGIAAIYLPPALLLRCRAEALAHGVGPAVAIDEETRAALSPLAPHPFDQFRQVATMVMPALVGLLPVINDLFGISFA